MKIITQLAAAKTKSKKTEDDFGRNDDDWDVYNVVRKVLPIEKEPFLAIDALALFRGIWMLQQEIFHGDVGA